MIPRDIRISGGAFHGQTHPWAYEERLMRAIAISPNEPSWFGLGYQWYRFEHDDGYNLRWEYDQMGVLYWKRYLPPEE